MAAGLTATPALHTTQILGAPVFTYGYREAVVDGYLVDYEPPIQVYTLLSGQGIAWKACEEVKVFSRLDKDFNGQVQPVLDAFNDTLWTLPAA